MVCTKRQWNIRWLYTFKSAEKLNEKGILPKLMIQSFIFVFWKDKFKTKKIGKDTASLILKVEKDIKKPLLEKNVNL